MNDRTTLETHLNVFEHFTPKLPPTFRGSEFLFLANIQPGLQLQVFNCRWSGRGWSGSTP
jgi:hypothetical protein